MILWGDTATSGPEISNNTTAAGISYSVIQGGCAATGSTCGAGNLSTDPKLAPLANNGGSTETMALMLGVGSSAIDTGINSGCPATDQRGVTRPQGVRCDIGAFEAVPLTVSYRSVGAKDGWVLELGENTSVGGSLNATLNTFNLGDNPARKQYRAILSFTTSPLPDAAVITRVTLKLRRQSITGVGNPFSIFHGMLIDMRKGFFGTRRCAADRRFPGPGPQDRLGPIQSGAQRNAVHDHPAVRGLSLHQ